MESCGYKLEAKKLEPYSEWRFFIFRKLIGLEG